MKITEATDQQIASMKRFWEETPDQPPQRLLTASLLKRDFLSLIARLEKAEAVFVDMTEENELRELAKAATPGEWAVDGFNLSGVMFRPHGSESVTAWKTLANCQTANWKADAEYLSACSPDAILSLLDELSLLRSENEGLRKALEWAKSRFDAIIIDCQGASVCGEPEKGLEAIYHRASDAIPQIEDAIDSARDALSNVEG